MFLRDEFFANTIQVEPIAEELTKQILRARNNKDHSVVKALSEKQKGWEELEEGLVTWRHRVYVPKDSTLREDLIRLHHDTALAGHPGRYKTHEMITRNYWWPGLQKDIRKYIMGCEKCQRVKPLRQKPKSVLHPHDVPSEPWQIISVDLIGELPESNGYNGICVFVDRFTKQIHAIPTNMTITSEGMAKMYKDQIFRLHGIPTKIIHDPQLNSHFMKDMYRLLNIEGNFSVACHAQADRQTEGINQEIEQYLRIYINHHQNDWVEWLPITEFSYNNKI